MALRKITIDGGRGSRTFSSLNHLLSDYTGANGVKTGWTGSAGYCLSASAERGAVELTAIVLGSSSEGKRFDEAETLLDWGFENYVVQEIVSAETTLSAVPVSDYLDVNVDAVLEEGLVAAVFLPDGEIVTEVETMTEVRAPVAPGDRLGTMTVTQGNRLVAQAPVVAAFPIEKPGILERISIAWQRLWRSVTGGDDEALHGDWAAFVPV